MRPFLMTEFSLWRKEYTYIPWSFGQTSEVLSTTPMIDWISKEYHRNGMAFGRPLMALHLRVCKFSDINTRPGLESGMFSS